MSMKEQLRNQIANKKKEIDTLRANKTKLTADKKSRLESISRSLKSASNAQTKLMYKKQQVDVRTRFTNDSERISDKINDIKDSIKSLQEQIKRSS